MKDWTLTQIYDHAQLLKAMLERDGFTVTQSGYTNETPLKVDVERFLVIMPGARGDYFYRATIVCDDNGKAKLRDDGSKAVPRSQSYKTFSLGAHAELTMLLNRHTMASERLKMTLNQFNLVTGVISGDGASVQVAEPEEVPA